MKTSKQLKPHWFYVDGVVKGDILNTCKWSTIEVKVETAVFA